MIIWLASFPRSGNTLLRTVFKQTMDLGSYSDDLQRIRVSDATTKELGLLEYEEPWAEFYERASASSSLHLVKTHHPPRDNQPTIYIVRDGRRSLASYFKYHEKVLGQQALSQMALVMGSDYYGDWSEHYHEWVAPDRNTLLVRYEDLVEAKPELLQSIAMFIGYQGPISNWSNPFARFHKDYPDVFRLGEVSWQGAAGWTALIDAVFFFLHGNLMTSLGYSDKEKVDAARASLAPEMAELVQIARATRLQKKSFEQICHDRLSVIEVLDAEVKRLSLRKGQPVYPR